MKKEQITSFTAKEAYKLCEEKNYILLDTREVYLKSFKFFDIKNLIKIPISDLKEKSKDLLKKDEHYIVADASGTNSVDAVKILKNLGYSNIYNLSGGIIQWEKSGLPVITDKSDFDRNSCAFKIKA